MYVIIHLGMICTAHLIGESNGQIPADITHIAALDKVDSFYVNKYINHHAYKITFCYLLLVVSGLSFTCHLSLNYSYTRQFRLIINLCIILLYLYCMNYQVLLI